MYKIVNFIAHGKVSFLGEDGSCCASLCTQSRVILVRKTAFYVLELRVDMRCECVSVFERLVFKTAFDHVHSTAYKLVGEHAMLLESTDIFYHYHHFHSFGLRAKIELTSNVPSTINPNTHASLAKHTMEVLRACVRARPTAAPVMALFTYAEVERNERPPAPINHVCQRERVILYAQKRVEAFGERGVCFEPCGQQ